MRVLHSRTDTGNCEEISLGEALRLVFDNHEMASWTYAADMLHKSGPGRAILVEDGTVWIDNDSIDKMASDWWGAMNKQLPDRWVHFIVSFTKGPIWYAPPKVQYVGDDNVFYPTSEEALATFRENTSVEHTAASEPQDVEQHDSKSADTGSP